MDSQSVTQPLVFVTACLHYSFYLINMDAVAVRQSVTVPATVKLLVSLLIVESMIVLC